MFIFSQKIKLRGSLLALHARPHGAQLAHILTGLALTFGLLPPVAPVTPTKASHIVLASAGLAVSLVLLSVLLNQASGVLRWLGGLPSGFILVLLFGSYIELLRRKGASYIKTCQRV